MLVYELYKRMELPQAQFCSGINSFARTKLVTFSKQMAEVFLSLLSVLLKFALPLQAPIIHPHHVLDARRFKVVATGAGASLARFTCP